MNIRLKKILQEHYKLPLSVVFIGMICEVCVCVLVRHGSKTVERKEKKEQ